MKKQVCSLTSKDGNKQAFFGNVKLFVSDESVALGSALEQVYQLIHWQHCRLPG